MELEVADESGPRGTVLGMEEDPIVVVPETVWVNHPLSGWKDWNPENKKWKCYNSKYKKKGKKEKMGKSIIVCFKLKKNLVLYE